MPSKTKKVSSKKSSRRSKKSSRRSSKRSSRKSIAVWSNFTSKTPNSYLCNVCNKELSYNSRYGPRNLREHMERHNRKD